MLDDISVFTDRVASRRSRYRVWGNGVCDGARQVPPL